ncbi:MAG TPA: hypothetical protein VGR85_08210 [Candidatus Limnocylindria bacterium]|jgi:hypothetical protein|nr:hypothetical protein [Candidatus Limnocylindria bacterium]
MTRERMSEQELDATLAEVGERLAYPRPTRLADAVRARLREPRGRRWWDALRSPRYAFAPILATLAVLALVIVLAVPGARAAAASVLHAWGIDIFQGPPIATPAASPSPRAGLGSLTTLDEVRLRADFTVRVPTDPRLGTPDEVYRDRADATGARQRISLVYGPRAGFPISHEPGVSVLVVEFRGTFDEALIGGKGVGPDTKIESLSVNGGRGLWLEGAPHLFFYHDPSGQIATETLRLAGNTLIWEQDGVTLRLEAQVSRDEALRIAASFR